MQISLDTNIWIFAIVGVDTFCEKILFNLDKIDVIISLVHCQSNFVGL